MTTTYVGVDPSLTGTALVVLRSDGTIIARRCVTKGRKNASVNESLIRLLSIAAWVREHISNELQDAEIVCCIEGPSLGQMRQGGEHLRAGLWWILVNAMRGTKLVVVPPATLKKYATGRGNAGKDEVLLAVAKRYPDAAITNNDEADALVLAAIAARLDGHPIELGLPKAHLDALRSLT